MSALRDIRKARRLTLAELGKLVGLTVSGVHIIEHHEPDGWQQVGRFATALHCTTDELLGRTANLPVMVDVIGRADRELLDAMERSFDHYFDSPTLRRLSGPGTWRRLAHMAFCGDLCILRQDGRLPTGTRQGPQPLPPVEDMVKAPPEWFTSWESPRQQARAAQPPRSESRKALTGGR
jgi:transcriptional regulator with XRE-family HTH domain